MKARQSLAARLSSLVSSFSFLIFWRRKRTQRDFSEELQAHLALETDRLREEGMSEEEASAAARRNLGNITQARERFYESHRWLWLDSLWQDLRFGLRQLRRNPGFTAVAVVTLALGIGANTGIFSVVNAVLLRPLPFFEPERLISIISAQVPRMRGREASYPDVLDWRTRNHVFSQIAVFRTENFTLTGKGEPEHVPGAVVSANLFSVLRVIPSLGRSFLPEENKPGAVNGTNAAILSYGFWRQQFGSDKHIVGRRIDLGGRPFTIVGVAPAGFQFPIQTEPVDLWTTMAVDMRSGGNGMAAERGAHYLDVIARLKPGVTVAQAQGEMSAIVSTMNRDHPENHPRAARVVPLLNGLAGPARPALLILLAAVGCLLLVACANVANLLLARAAARQKEMSIRAALGASRGRMIRQVLTESVLLSFFGGMLGLVVGMRGVDVLIRLVPVNIPRLSQVGFDCRVLIFTAAASLVTGILFGMAPAFSRSRFALSESLKESGRGASGGLHRTHTHAALVIGEIAMALVLLTAAGLLIRSFLSLEQVDPGFDPHHVLSVRLDSPPHVPHARQFSFFSQVLERVRALPGVRSASGIFGLPFSEVDANTGFEIEGHPVAEANRPVTSYMAVAPGYFRTLGIPLRKGHDFTPDDDLAAPPVAIINETLAKRFFPGEDPIGHRIQPGISNGYGNKEPWREIVGVVGDVKLHSLAAGPEPECYVPLAQSPIGLMTLVIRTGGDPLQVVPAVRTVIDSANKDAAAYNIKTLDELLAGSVAQPRFVTLLLGAFAALALLLAAVGLYGLIAYSVARRTHEIGIRMALGAQKRDVLRLVVGQGMILTLIGVGIGIIGALGLTRFLSSLLYGVKPTDPVTFVAVSLILTAVALLACYIPARRAMKIDPMEALRYE
ncbi:MAG TPA: ABC transporter permease [Terriglobia bacterium]|nr:ABC transporter permease [Terriglobia bacterium]